MDTETERWIRNGTAGGSDCGWVDKVEWTGMIAESEAPMPTDWDQLRELGA